MKAIHNIIKSYKFISIAVDAESKIQKMKAIHNLERMYKEMTELLMLSQRYKR